jgi:MFS family permease
MNKINYRRVLLGGLIAGVAINIGAYLLNEVVLVRHMEETFRRFSMPRPGANFIAVAVLLTLLLGIVIVLLYAMIRDRFGPGPRTAIVAGLIVWFCVYVYAGILSGVLFAIPVDLLAFGIIWGLVEYSFGAVLGAWVYKEA